MKRRRWPLAEIATVLARYPAEGPSALAAELGRTEYSVHGLARRFGLRTARKPYRSRDTRRGGPCHMIPSGDTDPTAVRTASSTATAAGDYSRCRDGLGDPRPCHGGD